MRGLSKSTVLLLHQPRLFVCNQKPTHYTVTLSQNAGPLSSATCCTAGNTVNYCSVREYSPFTTTQQNTQNCYFVLEYSSPFVKVYTQHTDVVITQTYIYEMGRSGEFPSESRHTFFSFQQNEPYNTRNISFRPTQSLTLKPIVTGLQYNNTDSILNFFSHRANTERIHQYLHQRFGLMLGVSALQTLHY